MYQISKTPGQIHDSLLPCTVIEIKPGPADRLKRVGKPIELCLIRPG